MESAPEVQEIRAELGQIENEINSISSSIKGSIQNEYQTRLGRERELERAVANLTGEQQNEQSLGVQYNILAREVATNRSLYDPSPAIPRTHGVGRPDRQCHHRRRRRRLRASRCPAAGAQHGDALLVGLVLAALLTMLREQIFNRVRTPDDVRRHLSVPLLSTIPKPDGGDMKSAMEENLSGVSESFQTLTSILSLSSANGAPKSMFITSGRSSEGKSTTAFAVAKYLARRGKTVLIVDADLRRPQMHRLVGGTNEAGLSDILAGQADIAAVTHEASGTPGHVLHFRRSIPPDPVDLLSSVRLKAAMEGWTSHYDHVIVDGPPVLGLSDALIISSHVNRRCSR